MGKAQVPQAPMQDTPSNVQNATLLGLVIALVAGTTAACGANTEDANREAVASLNPTEYRELVGETPEALTSLPNYREGNLDLTTMEATRTIVGSEADDAMESREDQVIVAACADDHPLDDVTEIGIVVINADYVTDEILDRGRNGEFNEQSAQCGENYEWRRASPES